MLDAFTTKTAKKNQDEKVVFSIHQYWSDGRPLLQLDLEARNQKMKNIDVTTFRNISDLNIASLSNCTLCIDEISMKYINPLELNETNAKSIWMVIRETDTNEENPEEYLRNQFPGWVIVSLRYPLRTSKTISEKVKNVGLRGSGVHKNIFNSSFQYCPFFL